MGPPRRSPPLLRAQPDGVTVAEVREALGTTRKWAVPLLTILDARGITRRRDDVRVAGPRLPDWRVFPCKRDTFCVVCEGNSEESAAEEAEDGVVAGPAAALGLEPAGELGHLDVVGHDLAELIGVGQQPRVAAVDDLAL